MLRSTLRFLTYVRRAKIFIAVELLENEWNSAEARRSGRFHPCGNSGTVSKEVESRIRCVSWVNDPTLNFALRISRRPLRLFKSTVRYPKAQAFQWDLCSPSDRWETTWALLILECAALSLGTLPVKYKKAFTPSVVQCLFSDCSTCSKR